MRNCILAAYIHQNIDGILKLWDVKHHHKKKPCLNLEAPDFFHTFVSKVRLRSRTMSYSQKADNTNSANMYFCFSSSYSADTKPCCTKIVAVPCS